MLVQFNKKSVTMGGCMCEMLDLLTEDKEKMLISTTYYPEADSIHDPHHIIDARLAHPECLCEIAWQKGLPYGILFPLNASV